MKQNEYEAAEVVEVGKAQSVVLGEKTTVIEFDSAGMEPLERQYLW